MSIVLIVDCRELCRSQGFYKTLNMPNLYQYTFHSRAMLCFHTSDIDTIVGLDPPNPMLNQYISLALAHRGLGNNTGVPQLYSKNGQFGGLDPVCQCRGYMLVDHWVRGV